MRAVQDAHHVHVDHPPPFLGGRALDRPEQHHAGVVDERVQAPEALVGARDERVGLVLLTDVGGDGERLAAVLLDPSGERLDALGAPRRKRHRSPGPRAGERGGLADPRGGAGDRHDPAPQFAHRQITARVFHSAVVRPRASRRRRGDERGHALAAREALDDRLHGHADPWSRGVPGQATEHPGAVVERDTEYVVGHQRLELG